MDLKTDEELKERYIENLWEAAHQYEYAQINGTAVGMLVLGNLKGLPKSLAVQSWVTSIWDLYYKRKMAMTATPAPELFDFSLCGEMPYSIPELMAEVFGA